MNPKISEKIEAARELIMSRELSRGSALLGEVLTEMGGDFADGAGENLAENIQPLAADLAKFLKAVTSVREVKVLLVELNEFDINPGEWYCWPATVNEHIDPNSSNEALHQFERLLQGPEGWEPLKLNGCQQLNQAFERSLRRTGSERMSFEHGIVQGAAVDLVEARFFELVEEAFREMRRQSSIANGVEVMATISGGDYYHICRK